MLFGIIISILLISVDRITKYLAFTFLKPIEYFTLINDVFSLTFVENRGAAFGIFQGGRWFFVALTLIILIGLGFYYYTITKSKHDHNLLLRISVLMIMSGAIGNFMDRILYGYVIDFFRARFIDFPVFNVADIFIVIGTILFSILTIFFIKDENKDEER